LAVAGVAWMVIATGAALVVPATPANATFSGENGRIAFALDRGSGAED
jgi:hypothetical protein